MALVVDRLFREADWEPKSLTAVVVGLGPGSYTGLRVGLAATGALFMRGHHFQATCGAFVAVAAAVNLLHLSDETARHVLATFEAALAAAGRVVARSTNF